MKSYLLFFLLSFAQVSIAQNGCTKHTIKSDELKEKRSIWIGLPSNYHKDSSYAVVYVLDAEDRFDITYAITKELFENQASIPELIVVGLPNKDRAHRIADLSFTDSKVNALGKKDTLNLFTHTKTGNGLSFLNYLEKEVIPYINKQYSTNGFNTLIGHSLGGYFCAYILPLQTSFSALQIYDPSIWYNDGDVIKQLEKKLDSSHTNNLFISKGAAFDGPREYIEHHLFMIDSLGAFLSNYTNLTLATVTFEKDHNAMYLFSLMEGLSTLFKKEANAGAIKFGVILENTSNYKLDSIHVKYILEKDNSLILDTVYFNSDGSIPAKLLPPNIYTIEITIEGFPTIEITHIEVLEDKITFIEKINLNDYLETRKPIKIRFEPSKISFKNCG